MSVFGVNASLPSCCTTILYLQLLNKNCAIFPKPGPTSDCSHSLVIKGYCQPYVGTTEKADFRFDANAASERRVGCSHAHLYSDQ